MEKERFIYHLPHSSAGPSSVVLSARVGGLWCRMRHTAVISYTPLFLVGRGSGFCGLGVRDVLRCALFGVAGGVGGECGGGLGR